MTKWMVPNAIPSILGETLTNVQAQEGGPPLLKRLINRDNNIITRLIDYRLGPRLLTSQEADSDAEIRVISDEALQSPPPILEFWFSLKTYDSLI